MSLTASRKLQPSEAPNWMKKDISAIASWRQLLTENSYEKIEKWLVINKEEDFFILADHNKLGRSHRVKQRASLQGGEMRPGLDAYNRLIKCIIDGSFVVKI